MQFVIIAKDAPDAEALNRRMAARAAHLKNTDTNMKNMIMAVAMLNDQGQMNGSIMVVDFPARSDLDAWLASEPYVTQKVWQDMTILPCKVSPSFMPQD